MLDLNKVVSLLESAATGTRLQVIYREQARGTLDCYDGISEDTIVHRPACTDQEISGLYRPVYCMVQTMQPLVPVGECVDEYLGTFVEGYGGTTQSADWVVLPDILGLNLHNPSLGHNGELVLDIKAVENCLENYRAVGKLVARPTNAAQAVAMGY